MLLPLLIGCLLAAAVSVYGWVFRLDQSRAFYPTALIVIASYYVLFAVMGGSHTALIADGVVMLLFATFATVGHARNMWLVVGALAAHGVMDAFHGQFIANPGVPFWWPAWCAGYDIVAAAGLALVLVRQRNKIAIQEA